MIRDFSTNSWRETVFNLRNYGNLLAGLTSYARERHGETQIFFEEESQSWNDFESGEISTKFLKKCQIFSHPRLEADSAKCQSINKKQVVATDDCRGNFSNQSRVFRRESADRIKIQIRYRRGIQAVECLANPRYRKERENSSASGFSARFHRVPARISVPVSPARLTRFFVEPRRGSQRKI